MILDDRPDVVAIRQIAGDARPRASLVGALHQIRLVVAALPVVERDEHRVHVARRREHIGHVGPFRHAGKILNLPPVPAAILGHLQQPVVGAGVDQAFHQRRLVERHDVAQCGGGFVVRHRVCRPHFPHDRQLVPFELTREIGTDARPAVAAIVGAIHVVARPVQAPGRVRTDDVRRVPVGAIGVGAPAPDRGRRPVPPAPARLGALRQSWPWAFWPCSRLPRTCATRSEPRLAHLLPRRSLPARQRASGRMLFDCPVRRSSRRTLPSCEVAYTMFGSSGSLRVWNPSPPPTTYQSLVRMPQRVQRARRAAVRPVVLRAAADVVERLRVVDRHAVVLRHRDARRRTGTSPPRRRSRRGRRRCRSGCDSDRSDRIDDVMIDVHAGLFPVRLAPRLAAVGAAIEVGVHRVDRVGTIRIDEDLLVVGRAAAAIPVARHFGGRAGATRALPAALRTAGALSTDAPAGSASPAVDDRPPDSRPRRAGIVGSIEARFVNDRSVGLHPATTCATPPRRLAAPSR